MTGAGVELTLSQDTGAPMVSLRGQWRDRYARYFTDGGYTALELNGAKGFVGEDLDFLQHIPTLRELVVLSGVPSDAGLRHCPLLERLHLTTASTDHVDLRPFVHLRTVFLGALQGKESVLALERLTSFYLYGYPYADLVPLAALTNLERLEIGPAPRLASLYGLERVAGRLTFFGVYHAPRLSTLDDLPQASGLRTLEIDSCRGLSDLSPIGRLPRLRRLALIDCGELASLRPMETCAELAEFFFYGTTKIRDGDLSVLERLPQLSDVAFQNRRHYNRRREDLAAWRE